jgi:hypothetical protein
MFVNGSIAGSAATAFGMAAAAIAVFGFAAHIKPAFSGAGEKELREATLVGGMVGLGVSLFVIVLSALIG